MSHACSDDGAAHRGAALPGAAQTLGLAASPTFALMALLTSALSDGSAETLCSGAHTSPLGGMATMYLLMSAFHAAPWLKLISRGRGRIRFIGKTVRLG
jgi:hypothetical protein